MILLDDGKIIDDGDTETLINRPEKTKTVEFVSKSMVFQTRITSKLFDHIQVTGKI
ncbi:MAG: hypothetical protein MJ246_07415 [Clostridia bacterium]|nr:hypothetical protein [Clostridia bacterium]